MISRFINYIRYKFLISVKPEMKGGFLNKNKVFLNDVRISNMTHISYPNNLDIGNNVFIGHFNYIDCSIGTHIGEGVQITNYVSILNHSSHNSIRILGDKYNSLNDTYQENKGKIKIGKFSFIGSHVTIMPNTTIGDGCIVGAFSFVKGNFPDFSIIRGVPATIVGNTKEFDLELLKKYPEFNEFYYTK